MVPGREGSCGHLDSFPGSPSSLARSLWAYASICWSCPMYSPQTSPFLAVSNWETHGPAWGSGLSRTFVPCCCSAAHNGWKGRSCRSIRMSAHSSPESLPQLGERLYQCRSLQKALQTWYHWSSCRCSSGSRWRSLCIHPGKHGAATSGALWKLEILLWPTGPSSPIPWSCSESALASRKRALRGAEIVQGADEDLLTDLRGHPQILLGEVLDRSPTTVCPTSSPRRPRKIARLPPPPPSSAPGLSPGHRDICNVGLAAARRKESSVSPSASLTSSTSRGCGEV